MEVPARFPPGKPESRCDDIFVSVCVADLTPSKECLDGIRRLASKIAERYSYWEILIVVDALVSNDFVPLVRAVNNTRLIKVRAGVQTYQRRVIAASEAIGDIVLLSSAAEMNAIDLIGMLERAWLEDSIVIGVREKSNLLNPALLALGNFSGYRVSTRDLATAAFPRTLLNRLLSFPDRQLVLRFIPRDAGLPVVYVQTVFGPERRTLKSLGQRLGLIQRLLINSAPRVLGLVSLMAAVTALISLCFAVYAIMVWLLMEDVQPGWLTTSLAVSLTASFLGVAIFGLASGMQKLIDLASAEPMQDVVGEDSSIDLYSQTLQQLNVEVDLDAAPVPIDGKAPSRHAGPDSEPPQESEPQNALRRS